ncbi:MAG: HNH endonuclease signature motif containing protein [Patescibacteria group bacterium]
MKEAGPRQVNPANNSSFSPIKKLGFIEGRVYGVFPDFIKNIIRKRADYKCEVCGSTTNCQCHHIFPESLGGRQEPVNGVLLCESCHERADRVWRVNGHVYKNKGQYVPIKRRLQLCEDREIFNDNKVRLISEYRKPKKKKRKSEI